MGRKAEPGISYYQMECDHTSSKKIKLLIHDHDSDGYWVWCCIVAYSYKKRGYYFDLNDPDELLLFSEDDCKKTVAVVSSIIKSCVARGLFDRELYEQYNILTSDRMQETYLFATSERRRKGTTIEMIKEFILIEFGHDTRNISILPHNNSILPGNKAILPRNNSDEPGTPSRVAPTEEAIKAKELKAAYTAIKKDKHSVYNFIKKQQPAFIDPFVDIWNIWAVENNKQKVECITDKRKTHFNARIKEKEFDFLELLTRAKKSQLCIGKKWFSFDFLIKNKDNYIKLLEGNYDDDLSNGKPEEAVNAAEAKLEKLINKQK